MLGLLAVSDLLLHGSYFLIPDAWLRDELHFYSLVRPSAALIGWLDPTMTVAAQLGGVVGAAGSSQIRMSIVRGCDGAGVMFLLVSGVIALRGPIRWVVLGVALAALWSYGINLARVVGLYFVLADRPADFDTLHSLFVPLLVIVLNGLFVLGWVQVLDRVTRGSAASERQGVIP